MGTDDLTKEVVEKAFTNADGKGTGKLEMDQLKVALGEIMETGNDVAFITNKEMLNDEKALKMFVSCADKSGDKLINLDELLYILDLGEEKVDQKEVFTLMIKAADLDGNGFISAEELKNFALTLKLEEEDEVDGIVNMFMSMGDTDGDRKLSIEEVTKLFTEGPKKDDPKEEMKRMFRMYDTNGDGFISKKEILGLFKTMGFVDEDDTPGEVKMIINMMMSKYDEDKDGKMNYDEFCKMMDRD